MKRLIILPLIILIIAGAVLYAFCTPGNAKNKSGAGFAVLELFTSEGCSSCPPADAGVAKLVKEFPGQVYVLGFHVDYWDYLGWKDAFSNAAWSDRQKEYGKILNLSSIYTPQAIINGKTELVGSDESNLRNDIQKEIKNNPIATIKLDAEAADKTITLSYQTVNNEDALLNVALVQLHAESNVKKGENEGKKLTHINIVRSFQSVPVGKDASGNLSISLPQELSARDCKIISYLQDKKNWHVIAAAEISL